MITLPPRSPVDKTEEEMLNEEKNEDVFPFNLVKEL
jgi:hypothetical protein